MSVGSPTAGTWSSSQWRSDNEFETDRFRLGSRCGSLAIPSERRPSSDSSTPCGARRRRPRHPAMPIYRIENDNITPLERTTFAEQGLRERSNLQGLLKTHIDVIAPDTLVVAEEFGEWEDSRRRIDLLGVDKGANLVVIELKRTEDGGHMDLQSIRYAAMISTLTFRQAGHDLQTVPERQRHRIGRRGEIAGILGLERTRRRRVRPRGQNRLGVGRVLKGTDHCSDVAKRLRAGYTLRAHAPLCQRRTGLPRYTDRYSDS